MTTTAWNSTRAEEAWTMASTAVPATALESAAKIELYVKVVADDGSLLRTRLSGARTLFGAAAICEEEVRPMAPAGAPATTLGSTVPAQNKQNNFSLLLWCFLCCGGDVPFHSSSNKQKKLSLLW